MKAKSITVRGIFIGTIISMMILPLKAQEESSSSFDVGADLVSNYIWRGSKFGVGPQIQPFVEFSAGNFTIGSWGSFGADTDNGALTSFAESDLYLSYGFGFGLSIGLTDYYYPGTDYFDISSTSGAHGLEVNLGYEVAGISLGANYMINEAGGAGTAGGDMYFELGYAFEHVSLFVGAGDGWHTSDGDFAVCNVGMTVSKELALTEKFSLPMSGSVILNPEKEQYFVVLGVSF